MTPVNFSNYENIQPTESSEAIGFAAHSPGNVTPYHWHEGIEILYLYGGDLTVYIEHQEFNLQLRTFVLINAGSIHGTRSITGNEALVLQIPDTFFNKYMNLDNTPLFYFSNQNTNEQLADMLKDMFLLLKEKPSYYNLMFNSQLFSLVYFLINHFSITEQPLSTEKTSNTTLKKILEYTNQHFKETISIDDIASFAGFQPKYFCRFFKKNMNKTFLEYLAHIRLSYITKELVSTNTPLYKLKEKYNFTNDKLFNKTFKKEFNMTPTEFRKVMK